MIGDASVTAASDGGSPSGPTSVDGGGSLVEPPADATLADGETFEAGDATDARGNAVEANWDAGESVDNAEP